MKKKPVIICEECGKPEDWCECDMIDIEEIEMAGDEE
jgi:hypothetical protein